MGIILPNGKHSRHNPAVPDIGPRRLRAFTAPGQHSFEKPRHSDPNDPHQPTDLDMRGKIGQTVYQLAVPPRFITYVPRVKMLQRRRHVIPFDPRTLPQLRCRARWAAGVAAWQQLTPDVWLNWNDKGNEKDPRLTGLMLFLRDWCMLHPVDEFEVQALLWCAQPELPFLK